MILVSACLAGEKCNYRGRGRTKHEVAELVRAGIAIPVCPEVLGGLPTPRSGAKILSKGTNLDGNAVLDGKTIVITEDGHDVTKNYVEGAQMVLKLAQQKNITEVYLNQYSPSCGHGKTLGGDQNCRKYVSGDGVTTALLRRNGIKILTIAKLRKLCETIPEKKKDTLLDYF